MYELKEMDRFDQQILFLILLGAYENSMMDAQKVGLTSDMISLDRIFGEMVHLDRNEVLWAEAGISKPFQERVYSLMDEVEKQEIIELSVDGTIFPKEGTDFTRIFQGIIGTVCEELELEISFDGYSYERAQEITAAKDLFLSMLQQNQLEFSHLAYDENERICILSIAQLQKLAELSVLFDVYHYFDHF
ncbi:hypothetical protein [Ammoniphilus resinae]|uniref:Uncharacterized protein n=1 Tax=Ammoniphilus resinae TaxID=861532 RepID=A0ABS4GSV6_9BACL|nr:hypothetical protein [Ammoniphilus resinae]MBP1933364.1 hypothetical protein [Ammoniphilus resinae]